MRQELQFPVRKIITVKAGIQTEKNKKFSTVSFRVLQFTQLDNNILGIFLSRASCFNNLKNENYNCTGEAFRHLSVLVKAERTSETIKPNKTITFRS